MVRLQHVRTAPRLSQAADVETKYGRVQKNILGNLGIVNAATIQLEFKRADGQPVRTVSVKGKNNEVEQLPLFTHKDTLLAEVGLPLLPLLVYSICHRLGLQDPMPDLLHR